jgi:16S rRNA (cytidine1402-2'-O)-methyltransferase
MEETKGMLYLVATPIGNLRDMSLRGIEVLKSVDFILAEDTRHSIKLLNHFEIAKKLVSYHEHNQYTKADSIIHDLQNGKQIALITDAGTPGISDPGSHLVVLCQEHKIPYTIIPGPVALINALVLSGQNTNRFIFDGFLPMKNSERNNRFECLKQETRTLIFYEAPHKLKHTLKDFSQVFGEQRSISIVRELTKLYEEVLKFSLKEAVEYFDMHEPKGEYVLVVEGMNEEELNEHNLGLIKEVSLEDHMERLLSSGLSKKEALKQMAKERQMNKRDLYDYFSNDHSEVSN